MSPSETENNAYAKCGVTSKEHYGMLWYFLEWSIPVFFFLQECHFKNQAIWFLLQFRDIVTNMFFLVCSPFSRNNICKTKKQQQTPLPLSPREQRLLSLSPKQCCFVVIILDEFFWKYDCLIKPDLYFELGFTLETCIYSTTLNAGGREGILTRTVEKRDTYKS